MKQLFTIFGCEQEFEEFDYLNNELNKLKHNTLFFMPSDGGGGESGGDGPGGDDSDAGEGDSGEGYDDVDAAQAADEATSVAETQSDRQADASEAESQMAEAGMTATEIAEAMDNFVDKSPDEQAETLGAMQDENMAHSLSQRSLIDQIKAAVVHFKVSGLKSLGVNVDAAARTAAQALIDLTVSSTLTAGVNTLVEVKNTIQQIATNTVVDKVSSNIAGMVMNAAHTQSMRGIAGVADNSDLGDIGGYGGSDGGNVGVNTVTTAIKYYVKAEGADVVAESIDVLSLALFGKLYRRTTNVIGSAFDSTYGRIYI